MTAGIIGLIVVQLFCAVFFVADVIKDYQELGAAAAGVLHVSVESVATISLVAAILVESRLLMALLQRQAHLEGRLDQVRSAIHDVVAAQFDEWRLTRSEADVANFVVKGYSTPEIAEFRGSAEATVKSHLNAIYRKAGVRNRSELLSQLMDTVMGSDARESMPNEAITDAVS